MFSVALRYIAKGNEMSSLKDLAVSAQYPFLEQYVDFRKGGGEITEMSEDELGRAVDWNWVLFLDASGRIIQEFGNSPNRSAFARFFNSYPDFHTSLNECALRVGKLRAIVSYILILDGPNHNRFSLYTPPADFNNLDDWFLHQTASHLTTLSSKTKWLPPPT